MHESRDVFKNEHITVDSDMREIEIVLKIKNISGKSVNIDWEKCYYVNFAGIKSSLFIKSQLIEQYRQKIKVNTFIASGDVKKVVILPSSSITRLEAAIMDDRIKRGYSIAETSDDEYWIRRSVYLLSKGSFRYGAVPYEELNKKYGGKKYKVLLTYTVGQKEFKVVIEKVVKSFDDPNVID